MIKKRYSVILCTIGLVFTLVALAIPFLTKYLIDEAINLSNVINKDYSNLIFYIVLISILTLVAVVIKIMDNFIFSHFQINLEFELKNNLYKSISNKSLSSLYQYKAGDIEILYEQDIRNVLRSKLVVIPQFVKQISRCVISLVLLFILDESKYKLMMIILISIGLLALVGARFYSKIIKPHHKKVLEEDSKVSSFFIESFNHHKQIISYDAGNRATEYYVLLNENAKLAKSKRNHIFYTANSSIYAFITIIYSVCIIVGAYFIADGIYTYGSLIAIVQLINNIEAPFVNLSSLINNYNLGKISENRLKNIMNLDDVDNTNEIDDFDYIEIKNLSFKYDDKPIINDLNLRIEKGNILKIEGESGIGKTTLLMLILGYLTPNSGTIKFIKNDKEYDTYKSRHLFSYLQQENILFSASILENIYILTGVKDMDKIINALKLANIYDELKNTSDFLNVKINNNTGLSVGQIQRILISILILYDKPILLLDEFSSSLDKENEKIIIDNLLSLNKTIIYITHRNSNIDNEKKIKINNQ